MRSSTTRSRRGPSRHRSSFHTRDDEYSYVLEGTLGERYGLEMDVESIPGLCERFALTHPLL